MPMHPIVSACDIATYNTAKFITVILQNDFVKTSFFIKESTDFVQKIKHLAINAEEFSYSHLMSVLSSPAYQHINSKISTCTSFTNVCKIPTEQFTNLLEFTITNCIFCFNKQLQGAPMDSPVSLSLQIST